LKVVELQYRGFPALAGAQPNRRRHYNIGVGVAELGGEFKGTLVFFGDGTGGDFRIGLTGKYDLECWVSANVNQQKR
jgi:hypothetical protein